MTRSFALWPLVALALTGCGQNYLYPPMNYPPVTQGDVPPPGAEAASYHALGTEPFWNLIIDPQAMRYDSADGERFTVPTPPAAPSFNGLRYVSDGMTVDVTYSECSDGMSDRRFHDTVAVRLPDGRDLSGCGGALLPPETLAGTSWRIDNINGLPVQGPDAQIRFDGQTVSGSAGCNRFNASYTVDGMAVSFGPAATTRMACDAATMGQERALLDLIAAAEAQPVGERTRRLGVIRYAPNGNMILTAPEGRVAVLAPLY